MNATARPVRTAPPPPRSTASPLAVVALVVAVLPGCPFAGLIGALLGVIALRKIARGRTVTGGRRLATVAIVAGMVSSLVWSVVFDRFVAAQEETEREAIVEQMERTVRSAQDGRTADARATWSDRSASPDDESFAGFGATTRQRYGAFERFSLISRARSGSILAPRVDVAGIFHFEREALTGSARFEIRFVPGRFSPSFRLVELTVEDERLGKLGLGADTTTADP